MTSSFLQKDGQQPQKSQGCLSAQHNDGQQRGNGRKPPYHAPVAAFLYRIRRFRIILRRRPLPRAVPAQQGHGPQVFVVPVKEKSQRFCKVVANKTIHHELADLPLPQKDQLRTKEHPAVGGRQAPDDLPAGFLGPRQIKPELHEVQRRDDERPLQPAGLPPSPFAQAAGTGEPDERVLPREEHLQPGIAVKGAP